jgi:hypothetical protein
LIFSHNWSFAGPGSGSNVIVAASAASILPFPHFIFFSPYLASSQIPFTNRTSDILHESTVRPISQSISPSQSDKHSIKMSGQQSKAGLIAERQANLPLPEDPPVASDWNSADARTVNVMAGERQEEISMGEASSTGLREPATQGSGVREEDGADMSGVGRQGKEGLSGPPKDATSR